MASHPNQAAKQYEGGPPCPSPGASDPIARAMKRIKTFLASSNGKLAAHYAVAFLGAAAAAALASSQHLAGIHGVNALAAALVGIGSVAVKAGYDAVRKLAIPAVLAYLAKRGIKTPPAPPAPPVTPAK